MIKIVLAKSDQIDHIYPLYADAREFMKKSGNPNQWINGYPSKELIEQNISDEKLFIVIDENESDTNNELHIVAAFYFAVENDPTYDLIFNGKWLDDNSYGVLHRIVSSGKIKGITDICLNYIFDIHDNIRVDTHKDNKVMRNALTRNGFVECGIIYTSNNSERIAFHKNKKH